MKIQQLRAQIAALQDATMDENKNFPTAYDEGKFEAFSAVDALLDSFEEEPVSKDLEEVDLKKEVEAYRSTFYWDEDLYKFAKHFYELGLRASNPITATDRGTAEEIIINLKRVEKDYRIDLTREIEWLRNKVKKGK